MNISLFNLRQVFAIDINICYNAVKTKMLLNTVLNSATAQQFRDTIFKILRVRQYRISSILSQSLHNLRFVECYQEAITYM